jgi:hypothetical protein
MSLEIVPKNDFDTLHGMFDLFARDLLPEEGPVAVATAEKPPAVSDNNNSNNNSAISRQKDRVIQGFSGVKESIRAILVSDYPFIDDNIIGAMAFEMIGEFSFMLESTVRRSLSKYKPVLAAANHSQSDPLGAGSAGGGGGYTTATQAAAAAAAEAIVSMNASSTEIVMGPPPAYYKLSIKRGLADDTFFNEPLNIDMFSNERIFDILRDGSDHDVIALPGLVNPVPGSMPRTAQMLEAKFAIDATFRLVHVYRVSNLALVYRWIGALADRLCLGCKVPARKNACVAGKWRCSNCESYGRSVPFSLGMDRWISRGGAVRHAV